MIQGTTRLAAVIGWPVAHSRSPQLLNAAFAATQIDAVLVPMAVAPDDLAAAVGGLKAAGALGASVTIPHKLAVAALCDELDPTARSIGAVNCLQFDGARVVGHNTDAGGFADGLIAGGCSVSDAAVVVLGAGGAARAVVHGLAGAGSITVVARRPEEVTWTRAIAWTPDALGAAFANAELVVDCTPIGLDDANEIASADPIPLDALPDRAWVSTLVYHRTTRLLARARGRGLRTIDGRAMLVHQAARAFTLWTGAIAPVEVMTRALATALDGP